MLRCYRVAHVFFSGRSRYTRYIGDWSSDVCCSDLVLWRLVPPRSRAEWPLPPSAILGAVTGDGRMFLTIQKRSEERRVGKECRSRSTPIQKKNNFRRARRKS